MDAMSPLSLFRPTIHGQQTGETDQCAIFMWQGPLWRTGVALRPPGRRSAAFAATMVLPFANDDRTARPVGCAPFCKTAATVCKNLKVPSSTCHGIYVADSASLQGRAHGRGGENRVVFANSHLSQCYGTVSSKKSPLIRCLRVASLSRIAAYVAALSTFSRFRV